MGGLASFLPLLLVLGGMMFFMNRTQKKQQNQRQQLLDSVKPGSEIITIGGLYGIVHEIDTDKGTVTIDCEGVYLEFERGAIKTVKPSDTPVAEVVTETVTTDAADDTVVEEDTTEVIEEQVESEESK